MAELAGRSVVLKISGAAVAMAGEATDTIDNITYQIVNAAKQVIDWNTALTVLDGGIATVEDYTVNYLNGKIIFETIDITRVITVTGAYLPMSTVAYANSVSTTKTADLADASVFGNEYKTRKPLLKSASGTLTSIDVTDETYIDALLAGDPIVFESVPVSGESPDRFMILIESDEMAAEISGLQNQVVTWTSTDEWINKGG